MKLFKIALLAFFVLAIAFTPEAFGQQSKKKKSKSLRETERKLKHSRDSLLQSLSSTDTSINSRLQRIEQYITTFTQMSNTLAEGLDTADVSQQLPQLAKRLGKIQALASTKKSSTLRYLFVLRDNLDHMQDKLDEWQSGLDDINTKLIQNQHDILKFTNDSLVKKAPNDSSLKSTFLIQRQKAHMVWRKTDSTNRSALLKVNLLQNKVGVAYTNTLDQTDQIDSKIKKFATRAFSGEFGYIWQIDPGYNNLNSAINGTVSLNNIQVYYFIKSESSTLLYGLVLLILVGGWIFYVKTMTLRANEHPETILDHPNHVYKRPLIASLLIATTITPYFYNHPPVAFLEIFFLISIIFVLAIAWSFPRSLFDFLLKLFFVTILYSLSNLLIQITNLDRFVILFLSMASILIAVLYYKRVKKEPEGHLPYTLLILKIFVGMQCLSVVLNFFGLFSIAKIVGITAVFNLWLLIILYFIVQIIIQCLFLQFHSKRDENSVVSWIDYTILQKKFMGVLNTFAALLWLFFLLQNLNIDDWAHDYADNLLNQQRTIGGATFTFGGFVIFAVVIWLSTLTSRVISYFYDISAQHVSDLSILKKKNRASTLLIRIGVFTVGFMLAVAASGFPLDKLTIIFSAFGVGIGFGLQNITNNLVSGMILAFEKPIQIGDIIEVDGKSGTVKEIGIRSSKLATSDGSEVIIPNADLISHHVENWTLNNNNRRVQVLISAAYGSDIQKVKEMLTGVLSNRDDIMTNPAPSVFVNNITDKSVDFRLLFWAADLSTSNTLRSSVLSDIYDAFNKGGIVVPAT